MRELKFDVPGRGRVHGHSELDLLMGGVDQRLAFDKGRASLQRPGFRGRGQMPQ